MQQTTPVKLNNADRTRCEIWTRVMGYHRPVSSWNAGKQSEHRERRYFQTVGWAEHSEAHRPLHYVDL